MPRRRPFKREDEKWNPKKHANRRVIPPPFEGRFTGIYRTGNQRVYTEDYTYDPVPGERGFVKGKIHGLEPAHFPLKLDRRKKSYRYRKPKK